MIATNRRLIGLATGALVLTACQAQLPNVQPVGFGLKGAGQGPVEGIIVQLKPGVSTIQGLDGSRKMLLPRTYVKSLNGKSLEAALAELKANPNVEMAVPDHKVYAFGSVSDPSAGQLWGYYKVQADKAWDTTTGTDVKVAVIDSGVDANHPDLKGQVVAGYDCVEKDSTPQDDHGHGTHVAGTIAAVANNGVGVAGMAYNAKIVAIRVLGRDGSGNLSDVADGIIKAQELGAKVINMSLGGTESEAVLQQAVQRVSAAGILVVAAAGNSNTTQPSYPAGYKEVLSVGASDQSDKRASFSNYGANTAIAAPGKDIMSTSAGTYKSMSGTSMASPHVAAAAALLWAYKPASTAQQIRDALVSSGDPVSGFGSNSNVKRMNVYKALSALGGNPIPSPTPTPAPTVSPTPTPVPTLAPTPAPVLKPPFREIKTGTVEATSAMVTWTTWSPSYTIVQWGPASGFSNNSGWRFTGTTGSSYQIAGLQPGTTYKYRLVAYGAWTGYVVSPEYQVTTR